MPQITQQGVAGQPTSKDVPPARNVVPADIMTGWKKPTGTQPRRKRRGG